MKKRHFTKLLTVTLIKSALFRNNIKKFITMSWCLLMWSRQNCVKIKTLLILFLWKQWISFPWFRTFPNSRLLQMTLVEQNNNYVYYTTKHVQTKNVYGSIFSCIHSMKFLTLVSRSGSCPHILPPDDTIPSWCHCNLCEKITGAPESP